MNCLGRVDVGLKALGCVVEDEENDVVMCCGCRGRRGGGVNVDSRLMR
jgi:hypothetical protein